MTFFVNRTRKAGPFFVGSQSWRLKHMLIVPLLGRVLCQVRKIKPNSHDSLDSVQHPSTYHLRSQAKKTSSRVSPRVVLPTNLWKHLTARLGQTQCGVGLGRSWISRNEQRKRPGRILSMKCWLFIRDPYGGLLFPHNWAVQSCNMYHPLYTRKNQGPFFKCSLVGACFQGDTSSSPPCYLFSKGLKHKPYHLWYLSFLYLYIYIHTWNPKQPYLSMDVRWNNHFWFKELESSNWNNHL